MFLQTCTQPGSDVILTLWHITYLVSEKNILKISHCNISNAPSNNVIKMSSVGVVETYLDENMTESSCLGAIFTCSIYYDIAVMCYFGGVLTSPNQNIKIMSYLGSPPLPNCMVTS